MSEEEQIQRLRSGVPEAIEELRTWVRRGLARYREALGAEYEDLEQDAMLEILNALDAGRFLGMSSLATYAFSCARFNAIDTLRAKSRSKVVAVSDYEVSSSIASPQEELEGAEFRLLAEEIRRRLPESCQRIWLMLEEGFSYEEMAEALDLRPGTLRVRVYRCRKRALRIRESLIASRIVTNRDP